MKTFRVYATIELLVYKDIEADDEDDAEESAQSYGGNPEEWDEVISESVEIDSISERPAKGFITLGGAIK